MRRGVLVEVRGVTAKSYSCRGGEEAKEKTRSSELKGAGKPSGRLIRKGGKALEHQIGSEWAGQHMKEGGGQSDKVRVQIQARSFSDEEDDWRPGTNFLTGKEENNRSK